ncbi:RNA polymerase sigma factor sigD [Salix suchowensis]|nr:RNA polymerase sigma factor sigD [Salix suchowensis]
MAIITTICSSSTTIFSAIPSLKHPLSHHSPPPTSSPPSFKLGVSSISNEAGLDIGNATETVASSSWTGVEVLFDGESDNGGLKARRKRRRRRRKGFAQSLVVDDGERDVVMKQESDSWVREERVLSPKEEAEFSMCLKHEARIEAARRRIGEAQELDPTSKQLAKALLMEKNSVDNVLCKGRESREKILRSYRRLVVSIATGYQDKGLSLEDLIQEGSIGLLRGAERFDPQRGYKLSTYAYWWIKEAILTAISKNSRMVRLPRRWWMLVAKIAGATNDLNNKLRRSPSYDEIAEVLNVKVSTVRLGFERGRSPISLDQAVLGQNSLTLQEIIPGPDESIPENMVKKELLKQELEKLFQTVLTEREAHVLRLHFGLNGQTPQSCEEIGRLVKLSRERVRQIIGIALSKLRQKRIVDPLKAYAV